MRIINCGGYGNTGCTAQTDFLSDYEGVMGALRPFHELGILKCRYSFGGVMLATLHGWDDMPTKDQLRRSIKGQDPQGSIPMTGGSKAHLELRALLAKQIGEKYDEVVDNAVDQLPSNYDTLKFNDLVKVMREVVQVYLRGLLDCYKPEHFHPGEYDAETSVIGFKNDPPGAYPIFATMLLGGQSSAILRDPRDTTYDFNRHYQLGHTMETVIQHCNHYAAQLNSAKMLIERFEAETQPFYKVIDFENLVESEGLRDRYRNLMIGPRKRVRNSFNPEKSRLNLRMWNKMPKEFVDYVEEHTLPLYVKYRQFLKDRDMLLE